jgi:addiction module HigA family antidote
MDPARTGSSTWRKASHSGKMGTAGCCLSEENQRKISKGFRRGRGSFFVDHHWEVTIMSTEKLAPIHPGEVLLEDFLKPMGISQYRLAKSIHVHPRRINEIVHGKRAVTADTALRLARFFGTSTELWMNLQSQYEIEVAKETLKDRLVREVQPYVANV